MQPQGPAPRKLAVVRSLWGTDRRAAMSRPCGVLDASHVVGDCTAEALRPIAFSFQVGSSSCTVTEASNALLPVDVAVPCDHTPLSSSSALALIIAAGTVLSVLLTFEAFTLFRRRHSSGFEIVLVMLMTGGTAGALLCPLYLAAEPTDATCATRLVLHASVHLLYASLFARVVIVYLNGNNGVGLFARVLPHSRSSAPQLLRPQRGASYDAALALLLALLANAGLFAAWLGLSAPHATSQAIAIPAVTNRLEYIL